MLFAPDIHRNLVSVLGLINYDFELRFHRQGVDLFLEQQFCHYGYFLDGYIVIDIEQGLRNECFSYITYVVNYENDVEVWHARLSHIGQSRMNQLAKEGLLGTLDKIELSTCEQCLAGKTVRKPFGKGTRAESPSINPFKHLWSDECKS